MCRRRGQIQSYHGKIGQVILSKINVQSNSESESEQSAPFATSPKPLSSKYSFRLVKRGSFDELKVALERTHVDVLTISDSKLNDTK